MNLEGKENPCLSGLSSTAAQNFCSYGISLCVKVPRTNASNLLDAILGVY